LITSYVYTSILEEHSFIFILSETKTDSVASKLWSHIIVYVSSLCGPFCAWQTRSEMKG